MSGKNIHIICGKYLAYLAIFLHIAATQAIASTTPQQDYFDTPIEVQNFDNKTWKKAKQGLQYEVKEPKKQKKEEPLTPKQPPIWKGGLFKAFIIMGILVVLILLLYFLVGPKAPQLARKNKKVAENKNMSISEELTQLPKEGALHTAREAAKEGQYKQALRHYYLAIVQNLVQQGHIQWELDKTNGAYLRELRGSHFFTPFQAATLAFEQSWYGKKPVEKTYFSQLQPLLEQLAESK